MLRQRRGFQPVNRNVNLEQQENQHHVQNQHHVHHAHYHHRHSQGIMQEEEETQHLAAGLDVQASTDSTSTAAQQERLPRRENYPGYAKYRYRDQIARQQEKWNRRDRKQAIVDERNIPKKVASTTPKERDGRRNGSVSEVSSSPHPKTQLDSVSMSISAERSRKGKGRVKKGNEETASLTPPLESKNASPPSSCGPASGTRKSTNGRSR
ncbi:hypothetical protein FRC17_007843, partial [Serendipita sp. 399]